MMNKLIGIGVRRCLQPVWFAVWLLLFFTTSGLAATTYDFANLGAAVGGFKPLGNRFLVSESFTNDPSHSTTIYFTSGLATVTGIVIKADGVNLLSFDLNDMEFLIDPGPENITNLKITATRSVGDPVSVTLSPGLITYGSNFKLSAPQGADLSSFTNVKQLQFDVTMDKVLDLDFASITISNEIHSPPAIAETFGAASIPLNATTSLTFTVNNPNASAPLNGIAFGDSLPYGLVVAPIPSLNNSCGGTATAVAGSSSVSLSGASLAPSGSCTVSVSVQGNTPGVKNSSVTVTSANGGTGNSSNASLTVVAAADLTLVNTAPATAVPLNSLTYNITLTNNGPGAAQDVNVSGTLPANSTFKSVSMGGGSDWVITTPAVGGNGTVSCSKSLVAPGESAVFQVVVQIGASAKNGDMINYIAVASALTNDPDPANNSSTATSTVSYPARVELPEISYFPTLSAACTNASSPNTIKSRGIVFAESLTFNQGKSLTLKGGYDSGFLNNSAATVVASPLIVTNGTLTLENIVVK